MNIMVCLFHLVFVIKIINEIENNDIFTNFGIVQSGEIVYVAPELTNNSEETIEIHEARTTCPCFELLDYPKTCAPGESIPFPIRIDTARRVGATTQTLYIKSSAGEFETKIYGEVLEDVKSAPSTLIFAKDDSGNQVQKFYIWSHTEVFNVKRIQYNPTIFDVNVELEDPNHPDNIQHHIIRSYEVSIKMTELHPLHSQLENETIQVELDSEIRPLVEVEIRLLYSKKLLTNKDENE